MRLKLALYSMLAFFFALLVERIPLSISVCIGAASFLFLNIGANLFNDYYDRDHGPLIGLEAPTKVTKAIIRGAWTMKILGLILALALFNRLFVLLYILGIAVSYVYSHKSVRAKSNPFLSILFGIGSGSAIFFAGALLGDMIIDSKLVLGMLSSGLFLSSFHILTQIYETREDKKRHDNTIAIIYGKRFAVMLSLSFFIITGIINIYLFYLMNFNIYIISYSAFYFIAVTYLMAKWMQKEPESDSKDYHIVKYFVPYLVLIVYLTIFILYVYYVSGYFITF